MPKPRHSATPIVIDPASLDPHALAETFTLSWLGQVYEPLVGRGKNLELVPALAVKWEQPDPKIWRISSASERQVP